MPNYPILTLSLFSTSILALSYNLLYTPVTAASPQRSASYELQLGNFNMTSGTKSSTSFRVTDTVGQTAAGEFSSTGYKLFAGFQYLYGLPEFTFSIDDLEIDLGELLIADFKTDSNVLTISTRAEGYTLYVQADHPLRSLRDSNDTIPFTTCDGSCSISSASSWNSASNNGLGYHADGNNVQADFDVANYRPFPNAAASPSEDPQIIAQTTDLVTDDTVTITYKATIDQQQESGRYETAIRYIAVPQY